MECAMSVAKCIHYNSTFHFDNDMPLKDTMIMYSGFAFLFASSVFYGSNLVPVKKFKTGDGVFFQFIACLATWCVGLILNVSFTFSLTLHRWPMLGGFLWCNANIFSVPIIRTLGLSLGVNLWGKIALVVGWSTARLFGLQPEIPRMAYLNYTGVILSFFSAGFFLLIKPNTPIHKNIVKPLEAEPIGQIQVIESSDTIPVKEPIDTIPVKEPIDTIPTESFPEKANTSKSLDTKDLTEILVEKKDFIDRLSPKKKKILGVVMVLCAGLFYGECFTPMIYVAERDGHRPYIEYIFSYYTGILLTSATYFVAYSVYRKNQPVINNKLVLPGFACGILWAAGNLCQTVGTSKLSQSVSFPIANSGPAIVATLWSVFLFKEIRGVKNLLYLAGGFFVAISASILSAVSF